MQGDTDANTLEGVMDSYSHILFIHIYQPLHSGRIWHKVNF